VQFEVKLAQEIVPRLSGWVGEGRKETKSLADTVSWLPD
jgi:hypothetical protein